MRSTNRLKYKAARARPNTNTEVNYANIFNKKLHLYNVWGQHFVFTIYIGLITVFGSGS